MSSPDDVLFVATEDQARQMGARQSHGVLRFPGGRRAVSVGCHPATLLGIRVGDIDSTPAAREHSQYRKVLATLQRSARKFDRAYLGEES